MLWLLPFYNSQTFAIDDEASDNKALLFHICYLEFCILPWGIPNQVLIITFLLQNYSSIFFHG